jgi:integrase/recombinase XerD
MNSKDSMGRTKIEAEALTAAELTRVIDASKIDRQLHLMILLCVNHGLRASECCNLIARQFANGHVTLYRGKGSKSGQHPLTTQEKELLVPFLAFAGNARLFSYDRKYFYRKFRALAELCGLPQSKQGPHALKHTCATLAIRRGVSIPNVQRFCGWKSLSSMQRYLKPSDAEAAAAVSEGQI